MPSYEEIKKKIAGLEKQAAEIRRKELSAVVEEIRAKMAEYDLTVDDIAPRGAGRSRRGGAGRAKVKYRDPASGGTWTGRGRKPTWLVEALANGRAQEEFLA